jgi:hypothetical protein
MATDLQKGLRATMQLAKVNQDAFSPRNVNVFYQDLRTSLKPVFDSENVLTVDDPSLETVND